MKNFNKAPKPGPARPRKVTRFVEPGKTEASADFSVWCGGYLRACHILNSRCPDSCAESLKPDPTLFPETPQEEGVCLYYKASPSGAEGRVGVGHWALGFQWESKRDQNRR